MLNEIQTKFITEQARNENGQQWLDILKTLSNALYSTRGIKEEDWKPRQIAAEILEKEIIKRLEVGDQEITKNNKNQYI